VGGLTPSLRLQESLRGMTVPQILEVDSCQSTRDDCPQNPMRNEENGFARQSSICCHVNARTEFQSRTVQMARDGTKRENEIDVFQTEHF
jgi:hypothetical protein